MSLLLRLSVTAGVLAASSAIIPPASAATVGTITVRPATGTDLTPFTLTTSGACPAGTNVIATIFGPGFTADGENIVPNLSTTIYAHTTTGGVVLPISDTLRDFANDQPDPQPLKGKYRLRVMCRMNAKLGDLGDFVGSITFNGHHGYVVVNPDIPESVLATIAPVPQAAPPLPTSTATPRPGSVSQATASPVAVAAKPVAKSTATSSGHQPWLVLVGVLTVIGGVALALSNRRTKKKAA